jgi:hypothetical protein
MPAAVYVVELPPVFLARGGRDEVEQDACGGVGLAHHAPHALAVAVVFIQNWLRCINEKMHTQYQSANKVETK